MCDDIVVWKEVCKEQSDEELHFGLAAWNESRNERLTKKCTVHEEGMVERCCKNTYTEKSDITGNKGVLVTED